MKPTLLAPFAAVALLAVPAVASNTSSATGTPKAGAAQASRPTASKHHRNRTAAPRQTRSAQQPARTPTH